MCMQSMNLIWPSMWSGGVLTDDNDDDDDDDDDRQIMIAIYSYFVIPYIPQTTGSLYNSLEHTGIL